jgi:GNAT superfamily N-acetyltransferase
MGPRERVIGYLCSAPDTASFNERRTLWVRFPLLVGVLRGRIPWSLEAKNWIKRGLRLLPDVERSFDAEILQNLRSEYPAHLHINLDPTVQRGGGGSRLIEAMLEKMKTEEVPGVHLFCGQGPVAFYEKQGFRVISQISFGPKQVAVFAMARKTRLN